MNPGAAGAENATQRSDSKSANEAGDGAAQQLKGMLRTMVLLGALCGGKRACQ